ncbi:hypothetical protein DV702_05390 [Sporosarcina sp. PTS2304]|uniref:AbiJ-NTD4 domain-containing protein n=1 Tax=Sporosarcina sp. PTS2304 TaxID=2283194 RepID=UPI000E0DDF1A|nr:hypothetical protein [Sporosarcina sp. PTS2304]AXH99220.1 hypothetical protein DV702_05390 [Sporosarcina sp. PTS2304]
MTFFSQRYGYKNVRDFFQIEGIDTALKTGLWNAMQKTCFQGDYNLNSSYGEKSSYKRLLDLSDTLWINFFKERINEFPSTWESFERHTERYFFEIAKWYEIYDLIEFIAKQKYDYNSFKEKINNELEKEMSGYRLVGYDITPIVEEIEIQSIEEAINNKKLKHVSIHIESALSLLSDRSNPSYRNSIKESISAVEGVAKLITSESKAELKNALDKLNKLLEIPLHGALKSGFEKIYGYTSDGDGIRHSLTEDENVSSEDAKFMIVACSAFVNYLISKAELAAIEM